MPLFANHYIENIEGTVLDAETGKEISQANVVIVGTDFGTITDDDGKFKLESQFSFPMKLEILSAFLVLNNHPYKITDKITKGAVLKACASPKQHAKRLSLNIMVGQV